MDFDTEDPMLVGFGLDSNSGEDERLGLFSQKEFWLDPSVREFEEIKEIIESEGGILLDSPGSDLNVVHLTSSELEPERIRKLNLPKIYASKYVRDCLRAGDRLDLKKYRIKVDNSATERRRSTQVNFTQEEDEKILRAVKSELVDGDGSLSLAAFSRIAKKFYNKTALDIQERYLKFLAPYSAMDDSKSSGQMYTLDSAKTFSAGSGQVSGQAELASVTDQENQKSNSNLSNVTEEIKLLMLQVFDKVSEGQFDSWESLPARERRKVFTQFPGYDVKEVGYIITELLHNRNEAEIIEKTRESEASAHNSRIIAQKEEISAVDSSNISKVNEAASETVINKTDDQDEEADEDDEEIMRELEESAVERENSPEIEEAVISRSKSPNNAVDRINKETALSSVPRKRPAQISPSRVEPVLEKEAVAKPKTPNNALAKLIRKKRPRYAEPAGSDENDYKPMNLNDLITNRLEADNLEDIRSKQFPNLHQAVQSLVNSTSSRENRVLRALHQCSFNTQLAHDYILASPETRKMLRPLMFNDRDDAIIYIHLCRLGKGIHRKNFDTEDLLPVDEFENSYSDFSEMIKFRGEDKVVWRANYLKQLDDYQYQRVKDLVWRDLL